MGGSIVMERKGQESLGCPDVKHNHYVTPRQRILLPTGSLKMSAFPSTRLVAFFSRRPYVSKLSYSELCTVQCHCKYVNYCCRRINYWDISAKKQIFVVLVICISIFPTNVQVGLNLNVLRQNTISFPTNGNDLLTWWVFSALALGIFIWFQQAHMFWVADISHILNLQSLHNSWIIKKISNTYWHLALCDF